MNLAESLAEMHREPRTDPYWERIATELTGHREIARLVYGDEFQSVLEDYSALVRQCAKANYINVYQAAKDVAKSARNVTQRSLVMASVTTIIEHDNVEGEFK